MTNLAHVCCATWCGCSTATIRRRFASWFGRSWLGYEDVEIVGEAGSPEEALAGVGAARPDVVLLDLLPPEPRDSLVAELRVLVPRARIVVYSGYPVTVSRERHPDACAYLDKAAPFTALHAALRAAA